MKQGIIKSKSISTLSHSYSLPSSSNSSSSSSHSTCRLINENINLKSYYSTDLFNSDLNSILNSKTIFSKTKTINSNTNTKINNKRTFATQSDDFVFSCESCGHEQSKWVGKCPECNTWNSMKKMRSKSTTSSSSSSSSNHSQRAGWINPSTSSSSSSFAFSSSPSSSSSSSSSSSDNERIMPQKMSSVKSSKLERIHLQLSELNRVFGGGIVPGSLTLVGGDPGIGKSTLVMQLAKLFLQHYHQNNNNNNTNKQHKTPVVLYVSGEETSHQLRMRAERLGLLSTTSSSTKENANNNNKNNNNNSDYSDYIYLWNECNIEAIIELVRKHVEDQHLHNSNTNNTNNTNNNNNNNGNNSNTTNSLPPLAAIIVDSIQTMYTSESESATGRSVQVRECATRLLRVAKSSNIPIILTGHVTKQGDIAGPKELEHLVDTVLYLEGDPSSFMRMLRVFKNRFGSSDEMGMFEMTNSGLTEVKHASLALLQQQQEGEIAEGSTNESTSSSSSSSSESKVLLNRFIAPSAGCTIACTIEGSRPLFVEIQALANRANLNLGPARHRCNGLEMDRFLLLLAVLQKHVKFPTFQMNIFANVVGGMKLKDPSSDLAVAMAIVGSFTDSIAAKTGNHKDDNNIKKNDNNEESSILTTFVGELGLAGEVRPVQMLEKRIDEADRMGFSRIVIPRINNFANSSNPNKNYNKSKHQPKRNIEIIPVHNINAAVNLFYPNYHQMKAQLNKQNRSDISSSLSANSNSILE